CVSEDRRARPPFLCSPLGLLQEECLHSCRSARGKLSATGGRIPSSEELVPERGLEPPRPCDHCDLNAARLPVPPLGHKCGFTALRLRLAVDPELAGATHAANAAFSFCPAPPSLSTQPERTGALHFEKSLPSASSLRAAARQRGPRRI